MDKTISSKECLICKAQTTPMWRNGPLGVKTLCNACGVKYSRFQKKLASSNKIVSFQSLKTNKSIKQGKICNKGISVINKNKLINKRCKTQRKLSDQLLNSSQIQNMSLPLLNQDMDILKNFQHNFSQKNAFDLNIQQNQHQVSLEAWQQLVDDSALLQQQTVQVLHNFEIKVAFTQLNCNSKDQNICIEENSNSQPINGLLQLIQLSINISTKEGQQTNSLDSYVTAYCGLLFVQGQLFGTQSQTQQVVALVPQFQSQLQLPQLCFFNQDYAERNLQSIVGNSKQLEVYSTCQASTLVQILNKLQTNQECQDNTFQVLDQPLKKSVFTGYVSSNFKGGLSFAGAFNKEPYFNIEQQGWDTGEKNTQQDLNTYKIFKSLSTYDLKSNNQINNQFIFQNQYNSVYPQNVHKKGLQKAQSYQVLSKQEVRCSNIEQNKSRNHFIYLQCVSQALKSNSPFNLVQQLKQFFPSNQNQLILKKIQAILQLPELAKQFSQALQIIKTIVIYYINKNKKEQQADFQELNTLQLGQQALSSDSSKTIAQDNLKDPYNQSTTTRSGDATSSLRHNSLKNLQLNNISSFSQDLQDNSSPVYNNQIQSLKNQQQQTNALSKKYDFEKLLDANKASLESEQEIFDMSTSKAQDMDSSGMQEQHINQNYNLGMEGNGILENYTPFNGSNSNQSLIRPKNSQENNSTNDLMALDQQGQDDELEKALKYVNFQMGDHVDDLIRNACTLFDDDPLMSLD